MKIAGLILACLISFSAFGSKTCGGTSASIKQQFAFASDALNTILQAVIADNYTYTPDQVLAVLDLFLERVKVFKKTCPQYALEFEEFETFLKNQAKIILKNISIEAA